MDEHILRWLENVLRRDKTETVRFIKSICVEGKREN